MVYRHDKPFGMLEEHSKNSSITRLWLVIGNGDGDDNGNGNGNGNGYVNVNVNGDGDGDDYDNVNNNIYLLLTELGSVL